MIIYCVLIIIIINFRPAGVFGEWEPTTENLKKLARRMGKTPGYMAGFFKKHGGKDNG